MKCIVPLAGPDLWTADYGLRPLVEVNGQPIIAAALLDRAWQNCLKTEDYIFVVRRVEGLERLCSYLALTFPGCTVVELSNLTQGALFSVLAATSYLAPDAPFVVDLADILFSEGPNDPVSIFAERQCGAIVPVFTSSDPSYSYLRSENGRIVEAREKVVISNDASAGVYMFQTVQAFLQAAVHSFDNREKLSHKGALFICPLINGIVANGLSVIAPRIENFNPIGKMFHSPAM